MPSSITTENPLGFNGVGYEKLPAVLSFPNGGGGFSVLRALKNIKECLEELPEGHLNLDVALDDIDTMIAAVK
jgi:hypothetical protein